MDIWTVFLLFGALQGLFLFSVLIFQKIVRLKVIRLVAALTLILTILLTVRNEIKHQSEEEEVDVSVGQG